MLRSQADTASLWTLVEWFGTWRLRTATNSTTEYSGTGLERGNWNRLARLSTEALRAYTMMPIGPGRHEGSDHICFAGESSQKCARTNSCRERALLAYARSGRLNIAVPGIRLFRVVSPG